MTPEGLHERRVNATDACPPSADDGGFATVPVPSPDVSAIPGIYTNVPSISFVPGDRRGASYALVSTKGLFYSPQFGAPWSPVTTDLVAHNLTSLAWSSGRLVLSTYGQGVVESRSVVDPFTPPVAPRCLSTSRTRLTTTFHWRAVAGSSGPTLRGFVVTPLSESGQSFVPAWVPANATSVTLRLPASSHFRAVVQALNDVGPSLGCTTPRA